MLEDRKKPRYNTNGRACIFGMKQSGILLKNLSITGCCLRCPKNIEIINVGEIYKIKIKPERVSHTGEFEFQAECKWVRRADACEIGFCVTASPTGKHFRNYVDYITYVSNNLS